MPCGCQGGGARFAAPVATAAPPRPGATIVYDVMMPDGTTQSFPTLAEARAAAGTTGRILARAVPAPVP